MKDLLKHIIRTKVVSHSDLNRNIQSFPYMGPDKRKKPTSISPATLASADQNLKQTGQSCIIMYMYMYTLIHVHNVHVPYTGTCTFQLHRCGVLEDCFHICVAGKYMYLYMVHVHAHISLYLLAFFYCPPTSHPTQSYVSLPEIEKVQTS